LGLDELRCQLCVLREEVTEPPEALDEHDQNHESQILNVACDTSISTDRVQTLFFHLSKCLLYLFQEELCGGKEIEVADRELVEQGDIILNAAKDSDVAFLVVGDPFGATTHTDIILRARELNIPTQVVHNASILNAVGACGLQVTILFFNNLV